MSNRPSPDVTLINGMITTDVFACLKYHLARNKCAKNRLRVLLSVQLATNFAIENQNAANADASHDQHVSELRRIIGPHDMFVAQLRRDIDKQNTILAKLQADLRIAVRRAVRRAQVQAGKMNWIVRISCPLHRKPHFHHRRDA
jgi:hypothetical protein